MNQMKNMKTKKKYKKPEINEVKLIADEAVLQACKTTSGLIGAWNESVCASYWVQCYTPNS